jgi:hypothetical protein
LNTSNKGVKVLESYGWTFAINGQILTRRANLAIIDPALVPRFAALLAANVQNGPDLFALQTIWSATISSLNEPFLDALPVALFTRASQLHSGLIHFQIFPAHIDPR